MVHVLTPGAPPWPAANQGGPSLPWHGRWGKLSSDMPELLVRCSPPASRSPRKWSILRRGIPAARKFSRTSALFTGKRTQVRFNTAELIWRVLFLLRLILPDPENSSLLCMNDFDKCGNKQLLVEQELPFFPLHA